MMSILYSYCVSQSAHRTVLSVLDRQSVITMLPANVSYTPATANEVVSLYVKLFDTGPVVAGLPCHHHGKQK